MKTIYMLDVDGGPNSPEKQDRLERLAHETKLALGEKGREVEVEILAGPNVLSRKLGISTAEVHSVCLLGQAAPRVAQDMTKEFPGVTFIVAAWRAPRPSVIEWPKEFFGMHGVRMRREFPI